MAQIIWEFLEGFSEENMYIIDGVRVELKKVVKVTF